MKQERHKKTALTITIVAVLGYFAAKWWAAWSQSTDKVVGANIGAGLLGLACLATAGVAFTVWIFLAIKTKR